LSCAAAFSSSLGGGGGGLGVLQRWQHLRFAKLMCAHAHSQSPGRRLAWMAAAGRGALQRLQMARVT